MKKKLINLYEANFPLSFELGLIDIPKNSITGEPMPSMRINVEIKKLSSELFLCKGQIEASFKDTCQSCLKVILLPLNIDINTSLKDEQSIIKPENNLDESHFQNLKFFDLDKLIIEEIYLNYPSVAYCHGRNDNDIESLKAEQKIQPFKKIRDLLD